MSNLAGAVTPRPQKHQQPNGSPASRAGRTYTTSPSPIKPSQNPFGKVYEVAVRPPEATMETLSPSSPRLRKKQLIVSGDIRNLDSNFQLAMSRVHLTHKEIVAVFRQYDISVSVDEATTLQHEYEENNDSGLTYEAFVRDLVQLLKQTTSGTAREQLKKSRLAEHCRKLSTMQSLRVDEVHSLLKEKLRVSWTSVRDAFRRADLDKRGRLPKVEFARICEQLEIPVTAALVDSLVIHNADDHDDGRVDYTAFLTHFGCGFQHGDTNSVSFSLLHERPLGGLLEDAASIGGSGVNHTLHSPGVSHALNSKKQAPSPTAVSTNASTIDALASDPMYMEKLRITLTEKIAARHSDVKKAFLSLDKDGNGVISGSEFDSVLRNFNLVLSREESEALLAHFDTNRDGSIDYNEFFARFGDVMKPSAAAKMKKKHLFENSSLVFAGQHDVKGANKNRMALSSPGNDLKDAFSRLPDELWRAIYVECEMSDPKKTGVVPSAELLRVLGKYLGDLPKQHFASLFRACGSHVHQLMNYRQLVKSYRSCVLDPVQYFNQDGHAQTDRTYRKSPTESLVMVWSIRVQRAQLSSQVWSALKDALYRADARRQGRLVSAQFQAVVKDRLRLTPDQMAFLCFFYEDKNLTADQVLIRYGSFITDFEDSGLEEVDGAKKTAPPPKVEGKGRVRTPGYGIHVSHLNVGGGGPGAGPAVEQLSPNTTEQDRLRQFFTVNIRSLEAKLQDLDAEKRGFIPFDQLLTVCKELSGGKWKESSKALTTLVSKYMAQQQFYYRGFLLDFDSRAGLQTQALVVQEDDEDDEEQEGDEGDRFEDDQDAAGQQMDVYEAKEALRHQLATSLSRQKAVYLLFQRMDPGKSGLLSYPELRRVLERLSIVVDEAVARELCSNYEDEDSMTGQRMGQIKYLLLLHALGGRDPDKLDGMSDLSSHCSYYSAISISPRSVVRGQRTGASTPRAMASSRDQTLAAMAVRNAIEKPRASNVSGAAAATAVERKIKNQLQAQGKGKWKQLARAFQQVDSEHRGSLSATSFRKVLEEFGIHLEQEELLRLQLKYDVEQNGRVHYHEYLRNLTNAMSDTTSTSDEIATGGTLPTLTSPRKSGSNNGPATLAGVPEALRQGIKAKWKAIYASFKTLDKSKLGRVSTAHFRQLLEWYALSVSDEVLLQLLRLFDHVDDGYVDYNKFMRGCIA
ncbi:hypothetical protein Poli38472_014468 [Pythium oligandrum]|uniref:EF-hand domain-containing protein n=2 Tax=Pythiaceae TaxID=4782 RepID=A0A8K1FIR1_PYTOL|nr:hypothetical protein Poli38472_014468 [Pythium oligandrum]DBA02592.1 TPA: hypothetical protein N0F65_011964 [Lagenidium giganteum]|eukprot:TMW61007.1 hypothetical protein Poli38472_014468 [Pythium oligandrum]